MSIKQYEPTELHKPPVRPEKFYSRRQQSGTRLVGKKEFPERKILESGIYRLTLKSIKQGIELSYNKTHYNPRYQFTFIDKNDDAVVVWYKINASLAEKSTLRGLIESIALGAGEDATKFIENAFSDSNFLHQCIGLEFAVKLTKNVGKESGKEYNAVKGIMALRDVNYPSVKVFENCTAPHEFADFTVPYQPKGNTDAMEIVPEDKGEIVSSPDDEDDISF